MTNFLGHLFKNRLNMESQVECTSQMLEVLFFSL